MSIRESWQGILARNLLLAILFGGSFSSTAIGATPASVAECVTGGDEIRLNLIIEGLRNAEGTVSIAVYGDAPEDFLAKGKKLRKLRLPAQAGSIRGCLALPRPGIYAVTAYHDEDGDRHFTRNFLGLPMEGVAVSNNKAQLGIPSFKEAAISVNQTNSQITLKMHYP